MPCRRIHILQAQSVGAKASADLADAAVGGKDDDGRQARLQRAVQEREAFYVQHVHLRRATHKVSMDDQCLRLGFA